MIKKRLDVPFYFERERFRKWERMSVFVGTHNEMEFDAAKEVLEGFVHSNELYESANEGLAFHRDSMLSLKTNQKH